MIPNVPIATVPQGWAQLKLCQILQKAPAPILASPTNKCAAWGVHVTHHAHTQAAWADDITTERCVLD